MSRDPVIYLADMASSIGAIQGFCANKNFSSYTSTRLLRSAVERELSIIGEAMVQLRKCAPELCERISYTDSVYSCHNQNRLRVRSHERYGCRKATSIYHFSIIAKKLLVFVM